MRDLFTPLPLRLLNTFCALRPLLAFDFDGTLARITRDPASVRLSKHTTALLVALQQHCPVAVVSTRSQHDLQSRLHFRPDHLIANHGLEGPWPDPALRRRAAGLCRSWRTQVARAFKRHTVPAGVTVEAKTYTVTIHYRNAGDRTGANMAIRRVLSRLTPPPRIIPGKYAANLLQAGGPDKGTALCRLMRLARIGSVVYVGDDNTDEEVFRIADRRFFTIRVGRKRASWAWYYLQRQSEIDRLLKVLLRNFQRTVSLPSVR